MSVAAYGGKTGERWGRQRPQVGESGFLVFFFLFPALCLPCLLLFFFFNLQSIYPGSSADAAIWKCVFFPPLFVLVSSEVRLASTVTDKRGALARVGAR